MSDRWDYSKSHGAGLRSALVFGFGEGSQLFGVNVPQLLQLPLSSSVQILDVHHVRLLDACVLSELVSDSWDEAWFVLTGSQELPVQSQDLLLQLTVPRHGTNRKYEISRKGCYRTMLEFPLMTEFRFS